MYIMAFSPLNPPKVSSPNKPVPTVMQSATNMVAITKSAPIRALQPSKTINGARISPT